MVSRKAGSNELESSTAFVVSIGRVGTCIRLHMHRCRELFSIFHLSPAQYQGHLAVNFWFVKTSKRFLRERTVSKCKHQKT